MFCDVTCSDDMFQCHYPSYCIYKEWQCDGERDCSDGSDELQCPENKCEPGLLNCSVEKLCLTVMWMHFLLGQFQCRSDQQCINSQWRCDNEPDCADTSDEDPEMCANLVCEPNRYRFLSF